MRLIATGLVFVFLIVNPFVITVVVRETETCAKIILKEIYNIKEDDEFSQVYFNILSCLSITAFSILCTTHVFFSLFAIYGFFSVRPSFVKPYLYGSSLSILILIIGIIQSLVMCWKLTHSDNLDSEIIAASSKYLNYVYIGAGVLLTYFVWICIIIAAYYDVKRLRINFLEWIYKERSAAFNPTDLMFLENRGRLLNTI
uniref:MARVEL domain-containing protein n=1 Tax=Parastrongyloides trichosuri TaxID=131310 RepID=A0A0N4Z5T5_PARTI